MYLSSFLCHWYIAQSVCGHGGQTMSSFQTNQVKSHTCEVIWGVGYHNMGVTTDSWSWLLCPVDLVNTLVYNNLGKLDL